MHKWLSFLACDTVGVQASTELMRITNEWLFVDASIPVEILRQSWLTLASHLPQQKIHEEITRTPVKEERFGGVSCSSVT